MTYYDPIAALLSGTRADLQRNMFILQQKLKQRTLIDHDIQYLLQKEMIQRNIISKNSLLYPSFSVECGRGIDFQREKLMNEKGFLLHRNKMSLLQQEKLQLNRERLGGLSSRASPEKKPYIMYGDEDEQRRESLQKSGKREEKFQKQEESSGQKEEESSGQKEEKKQNNKKKNHGKKKRKYKSAIFDGTMNQMQNSALRKIQNRLKLSQIIYKDSKFRNFKHELNHLHNTYDNEMRARKEIRDKLNTHPEILKKHDMVFQ